MVAKDESSEQTVVGQEDTRKLQTRWGDGLSVGFVAVPNILLEQQVHLKIDCEQMVLLANLMSYWWANDELPFPRTEVLAKRTGLSRRTVQRRISQLEAMGLIKRSAKHVDESQRALTEYNLNGLVEKLKLLGKDARVERDENTRRKMGRPPENSLSIV